MFLVVVAMLLTSMFVAAAFAAANGDLPVVRRAPRAQGGVRRRRGRPELLRQAAAHRPGLLDAVRRRPARRTPPRPTRSTSSTTAAPTPASGASCRASPPSTRSSCCTRRSTTSVTQPSRSHCRHHNGTFKVRVTGRAHKGDTKRQAQPDRDVQAQRLPEVRVLHRPGEPRPAGRAGRPDARGPADATASTASRSRAQAAAASRSSSPTATPSTARCTPTTRACWSAARRASGARQLKDGSPGHDRLDRGLRRRLPATSRTAAAAMTRRRSSPPPAAVLDQRRDDGHAGVQPGARHGRRPAAAPSTRARRSSVSRTT